MHAHGQYRWLFLFFFLGNSVIRVFPEAAATTEGDHIKQFISESMACKNHRFNPALSIAVVKDGKVVFTDGFGHVDGTDKTSEKPTGDTLFGIGSLSKAFAATLLVKKMHDKGHCVMPSETSPEKYVRWSVRVLLIPKGTRIMAVRISLTTYLKQKALFGNSYLFKDYQQRNFATTKDTLAHRLGLANHNFLRFAKTRKQDIFDITKSIKKSAAMRTSYYHSNIMYGLMATLTEKLGNDTWENLMTSTILRPNQMMNTTFSATADFTKLDIAEHVVDAEGTMYKVPNSISKKWGDMAGSGNIMSSANDMAKWMNLVLSKGKNSNGNEVVEEDVIEDCFHVENPIPPTAVARYIKYFTKGISEPSVPISFTQDVYLLGWKQGSYRGLPVFAHTGSTWGASAMLMLIPSKNLGVYVSMTGRDKDYLFRTTTLTHIADLYLGEKPWITSSESCIFPKPYFNDWSSMRLYIDRNQTATQPLTTYLGNYTESVYGNLTVTLTEDKANLWLKYGWADFKLHARTKDGEDDEFYMEGQEDLLHVINFSECKFSFEKGISLKMTKWEKNKRDVPEFKKI